MAISKAQSRLPEGFKPEDLGQVGTLLSPQNSTLGDADCYLISYLSSPLCVGSANTFVVFIINDEQAKKVEKFRLFVAKRETSGEYIIIPKSEQNNEMGLFEVEFEETGCYRAYVYMLGMDNEPLGILKIEQIIVHQNAEIKNQIEENSGNLPLSMSGSPDTLFYVYQNLLPYIHDAVNSVISSNAIPSRLLSSIVYFQSQSSFAIQTKLEDARLGLDYFLEKNKEENEKKNKPLNSHPWCSPLGVCGLLIYLFVQMETKYLRGSMGDMEIQSFAYKLIDPKSIDPSKVEELQDQFSNSSDNNTRIDLFNLIRFPKTNIRLSYILLNLLKYKLYDKDRDGVTTEEFFDNCFEQVSSSYFLYNDFFQASNLEKVQTLADKKTNIIKKNLGTPFMQFLDSPKVTEARKVVFIPKQWEGAFHSGSPRGDLVLDPDHLAKYADDDISKGEHYGINHQELFNELDFNKVIDKEMILLDVGYWGNYDRSKPQRDFGIIEKGYVWLCQLLGPFENDEEVNKRKEKSLGLLTLLSASEASAIVTLVDTLAIYKYCIDLKQYAKIGNTSKPEGLTIIFPDMHLPEKWPDIQSQNVHTDPITRAFLVKILLWSQRSVPANLFDFRKMQLWIQRLLNNSCESQEGVVKDVSEPDMSKQDVYAYKNVGNECTIISKTAQQRTYKFSIENLLAEKQLLDRRLRLNSSWFYAPPEEELLKDGVFGRDSIFYYLDNQTDKIVQAMLYADPSPALDLAVFLKAILEIQKEHQADVIQVGDLYEMWMDREWLYLNFPEANDPNDNWILFNKNWIVELFSSLGDQFQFRFEQGWNGIAAANLSISEVGTVKDLPKGKTNANSETDPYPKPYIFHEWPVNLTLKRKKTGNNQAQPTNDILLTRCKDQVLARIENVRAFSLPACSDWNETQKKAFAQFTTNEGNNVKIECAGNNVFGESEYKWNKLILDLFNKVGCTMVYGNHDGYRGDGLLNSLLDEQDIAKPYYCENSIWVEHGHRWELENRDGVPFGPAMTNLVHYYFRDPIILQDKFAGRLLARFQRNYIPGFVRWFTIVNQKKWSENGNWPTNWPIEWKELMRPFTVAVMGHTHSPDLVKVCIKKQ